MLPDEYKILLDKYYTKIYNYCLVKMKNEDDAYDCVQQVFYILFVKLDKVELTNNISLWLYRTADKVISRYWKKNKKHIDLDSITEADNSVQFDNSYEILETLISQEEISLLEKYYLKGISVEELSIQYNISTAAMYKRIERLKVKLLKHKEELP